MKNAFRYIRGSGNMALMLPILHAPVAADLSATDHGAPAQPRHGPIGHAGTACFAAHARVRAHAAHPLRAESAPVDGDGAEEYGRPWHRGATRPSLGRRAVLPRLKYEVHPQLLIELFLKSKACLPFRSAGFFDFIDICHAITTP